MTTVAKKKKKAIGNSVWIFLNKEDGSNTSWVNIDGHPINGINRLEVVASATDKPQLVLYLSPEHLEIDGAAVDIKAILDLTSPVGRFEVDLE